MNLHVVVGRLTKEGELSHTNNGTAIYRNTVATRRKMKNANGQYESDYHDITVIGAYAETVAKNAEKGMLVEAMGEHQIFKNVKGDKTYYNHSIVVETFRALEPKKNGGGDAENDGPAGNDEPENQDSNGEGNYDPLAGLM